jgi:hypothetical protein
MDKIKERKIDPGPIIEVTRGEIFLYPIPKTKKPNNGKTNINNTIASISHFFTISLFRHFTISPFHHLTISPFHHFTISPFHHLTISPSHHLTISTY